MLAEPAMTNMGIVLPEDGYHERLRELTRASGTLLIIDETHTFSAGPGGCTAAWGLEPDMLTIGKAIGSGIPSGALGLSARLAGALLADPDADYEDTGGVGGTLAGNALSAAAMRATLEHVLTEAAFAHTSRSPSASPPACRTTIDAHGLPWHVIQLGCRAEYGFSAPPPRDGTTAHAAADHELERYLHLHALNRGVMITPFHNMALMSPATSRGRRRPPHGGLRRGRRGARGLMRVLALADQRPPLDAALMARKMHVDAVVLLGDLDRAWIEPLRMLRGIPRVGVHGNHDPSDLLQEMEVEDLHGRRTSLGGLTVAGFEGCVKYGRGGPHQYTQRQASKLARKLPAADVLIAHCPPAGINDDPDDPAHVGYDGLRAWVDHHRPKHVLHGHVHPQPGTVLERVGDTKVHWVQGAKVLRLD